MARAVSTRVRASAISTSPTRTARPTRAAPTSRSRDGLRELSAGGFTDERRTAPRVYRSAPGRGKSEHGYGHRAMAAERVQGGWPVRPAAQAPERPQQSQRQHLAPEVAPVKSPPEDRLVQALELAEREGRGQQREREVGVLQLRAQPCDREADHRAVVVGEHREARSG